MRSPILYIYAETVNSYFNLCSGGNIDAFTRIPKDRETQNDQSRLPRDAATILRLAQERSNVKNSNTSRAAGPGLGRGQMGKHEC